VFELECSADAKCQEPVFDTAPHRTAKLERKHLRGVALYFRSYNFARVHQPRRVTPATEAGFADHVWAVEEIAAVL
jgi:hypothetical protein